jgi:ribosomal protein L35AE/L33A
MNYRIGASMQYTSECIIQFNREGLEARKGQLIGEKVVWKSKNKRFIGKIKGFHGKNNLKVKFKKGVPGQAIGALVELIG